jgi:hypothetical protein
MSMPLFKHKHIIYPFKIKPPVFAMGKDIFLERFQVYLDKNYEYPVAEKRINYATSSE